MTLCEILDAGHRRKTGKMISKFPRGVALKTYLPPESRSFSLHRLFDLTGFVPGRFGRFVYLWDGCWTGNKCLGCCSLLVILIYSYLKVC